VVFSAATLYSHPNYEPIFLDNPPPAVMATYEDDVDYTLDPDETLPWFPTGGSPHPVSPRHLATSEAYTLWVASEPVSSSLCPLASSPAPPISPDPNPLQLLSREPPSRLPPGFTDKPSLLYLRADWTPHHPLVLYPSPILVLISNFQSLLGSQSSSPPYFPPGSSPLFPFLRRTTLGRLEVTLPNLDAHRLDPLFQDSCFFPDAGSGFLSESIIGGTSAGFIGNYLPPSNLNGWDSLEDGGSEEAILRGLIEDPDPHSSNRRRKRNKCIGVVTDSSNLILGEDLSMAEVLELADKSVVGKVYGRHFSEKTLKIWAHTTWGSAQPTPPQIVDYQGDGFSSLFHCSSSNPSPLGLLVY
jgi:hypothetical protein